MSSSVSVEKLVEALRSLEALRREIIALRSRLAEIREARKILEEKKPGTIFREIGGLVIEVTLDDALSYLRDEEELLETRLTRLEAEEKKLREEIARLEKELGLRR